jgi:hypothetical protein
MLKQNLVVSIIGGASNRGGEAGMHATAARHEADKILAEPTGKILKHRL